MVLHISIWAGLELFWGAKPPKVPRGDGTGRSYGHLRVSSGSLPRY